jgi:hypothetical protein
LALLVEHNGMIHYTDDTNDSEFDATLFASRFASHRVSMDQLYAMLAKWKRKKW